MTKLFLNKTCLFGLVFVFILGVQSCLTQKSGQRNQVSVCTWNLENFGHSKHKKQISFIAKTISKNDVIAIQEVVGENGGVDAVIRLVHSLDSICNSCQWDYAISLRTSGSPYQSERYAYLWKRSKVIYIGSGWLDEKYSNQIEREPFLATFEVEGKRFTLVSFHAIPKSRQPEKEIKYLKYFPKEYPKKHLIFLGDFNTPYTNSVFIPLKKQGYKPALIDKKTTLRQKCINKDCLASEYDNIFYPTNYIKLMGSDILHFYRNFNGNMKKARKVSDHVPVTFKFKIKDE